MDLPRLELVKQLRLHLSTEGRRFSHLVHDLGTGAVVAVSRSAALSLLRLGSQLDAAPNDRAAMTSADAKEGLVALSFLAAMRDKERLKRSGFNPLSMKIDLLDVGQKQIHLEGFARTFIGLPMVLTMVLLALVVVILGIRNDWAISAEFGNVFSFSALATFALIAPFLKVIHELGHVLFATWAGVRVRKAGLNLIGLYPLPFVDCSEADLTARRRDRILISLAGIITDVFIGMLAFIAWHFVEGEFLKGLAGRILVFNTLNSVLFNANPLMKMDGYYAAVDLFGQRNLSTRATVMFADARSWILTLGAKGALPKTWGAGATTAYGFASLLYRLTILYSLMTQLLPQYLGLGVIVSGWGAYAMFGSPLLADQKPAKGPKSAETQPLWRRKAAVMGAGAVFLAFFPLPFVQRLDLTLDVKGRYAVTAAKSGYIAQPAPREGKRVGEGDELLRLTNPALADEIDVMALKAAEAQLSLETVRAVDAAQSELAAQKIASLAARVAILDREAASLSIKAPVSGVFIADKSLRPGQHLPDGGVIGQLLPAQGAAILIAGFPERWVEKFQTELTSAEIWDQGTYSDLPLGQLRLVERVQVDRVNGIRNFDVEVRHPTPPAELVGKDVQLRLVFGWQPLWRHLTFWVDGRVQAFMDAQLADRLQRIE